MWVEFCTSARKSNNVEPWRRVVNSCSGKMTPSSSHANKKARHRVLLLSNVSSSVPHGTAARLIRAHLHSAVAASIVLKVVKGKLSSDNFHLSTVGGVYWSKKLTSRKTEEARKGWPRSGHEREKVVIISQSDLLRTLPGRLQVQASHHDKSAIFTKHSGIPQGCPPPCLSHLPSREFTRSGRPAVIGTINPPLRHRTLAFFLVNVERARPTKEFCNNALHNIHLGNDYFIDSAECFIFSKLHEQCLRFLAATWSFLIASRKHQRCIISSAMTAGGFERSPGSGAASQPIVSRNEPCVQRRLLMLNLCWAWNIVAVHKSTFQCAVATFYSVRAAAKHKHTKKSCGLHNLWLWNGCKMKWETESRSTYDVCQVSRILSLSATAASRCPATVD